MDTDGGLGRNFELLASLREQVLSVGACSLPGCSFDYSVFMPILQRAVIRGHVVLQSAQFVASGLRFGFKCGVDISRMRGRRVFRNYPTAFAAATQVTEAVRKRISASKTLCLGIFDRTRKHLIPFPVYTVFPMGAVAKKLEAASRPVDDHTRTLLNLATDLSGLRHSCRTQKEVAALFFKFFSMAVKDVSDAFPLIPLHPDLWPFMLFQWFDVGASGNGEPDWCLFVHLFAGFGMAGLPGVWKILFQDVLLGMARSEQQLTLPVPIFVDDAAIIGSDAGQVDAEAASLAAFLLFLGVVMKEIKTRYAATLQLYIGLWWNSVTRTLELEPSKLAAYLQVFDAVATAHTLTLRDAQSLAGKMQRCALTFPPGAECVFASLYAFMRGLVLPWQKRRVSRGLRADVAWGVDMLRANLGKGYFSYDQFQWLPPAWTDASKSPRYTGGGYVLATGQYSWFPYGTSASRKPIDELEGDVVALMVGQQAVPGWKGCIFPIFIDNKAFQLSGAKGWSKAERLNELLKKMFRLSVHYECVFMFYWISTHENVLADALSRPDGLRIFLEHPRLREFVQPGAVLQAHATCGHVRLWGKGFSSATDGDGPPGQSRLPLALTVSYTRASVFSGLPSSAAGAQVDYILDNRLGASSHASVRSSLAHWDTVRARHGWARIIATDDLSRGGKLATFVLYMVHESELVYSSISNYVWALRAWMRFQRQLDPVYGIMEWSDFMDGVEVLTFVPAEPRKEVPGAWFSGAVAGADRTVFWEVQAVLLMLILLFTFARSESPLAKSHTGAGRFDPWKNLQVQDVKVMTVNNAACVAVRLKAIKQDPRMQRPEARGEGDWIYIGDAPGDFSILMWLRLYFSFFAGVQRDQLSSFFVGHDLSGELTYSEGMDDVRALWARTPGVSVSLAKSCGLHGIRVAGNQGTTRSLGKLLAKIQGGWNSESGQGRYDRADMSEVVSIPGAIVSSWDARQSDFDLSAVEQLRPDEPPPPPSVRPTSAPAERVVSRAAGSANIRRPQPFDSSVVSNSRAGRRPASASSTRAATAPGVSRSRVSPGEQTQGPVAAPPNAPPPHSVEQRRVEGSSCLSLTRPVRASRLRVVRQLPVGVAGSWRSPPQA